MFERIDLTAKETPLQFFQAFSDFLGVPFYVKREDLCGGNISLCSSDARKMEFLIPDIAKTENPEVVTIGSYRQAFPRLLAQTVCNTSIPVNIIYTDELSPELSYNLSTAQLCGAKTHGTKSLDYAASLIETLETEGKNAYIVRPGGAGSVAIMGGYALMDELQLDLLAKFGLSEATIYVLSDSGTTQAGMLTALPRLQSGLCIKGVSMRASIEEQCTIVQANQETLENMFEQAGMSEDLGFEESLTPQFAVPSIPVGGMSQEALSLAQRFYLDTGIIIDHLYGIPVLSALVDDVQQGRVTGPVVFINPVRDTVPFFNYNT
jgi:1-aminocyclopropane-1-carboxylate deaminase/D-cysteine desulfhydrase-like pyridoxal-dependent ACC family enzyme